MNLPVERMNPNEIKNFIITWAILILAIALLSAAYAWAYPNPIVRHRLERIEAFTNKQEDAVGSPEIMNMAPADTTLELPREPYALLKDVLTPFAGQIVSPTSAACYDADFQKRLERTGNFRQMTNNYKRGVPDSCSAPNHDLSLSFYSVEEVPFTGYL
jgi:hypothetical protein